MSLRLIDHLENSLTPRQLMDQAARPAPEQLNPWAMLCAWCVDWVIAFTLANIAVGAWMGFMGPLGLNNLPSGAKAIVTAYTERTGLILAPIFFFTMNFVGIMFHSMTPGQRLFKHRVESQSIASSLLWSWASTVSLVTLGMPLLTNWLDRGAATETRSEQHHRWVLDRPLETELTGPDLVKMAQENKPSEADFKIAA
jgi:hypothetical protein